jgi:Ca2+-binding RTX toxin-like protein
MAVYEFGVHVTMLTMNNGVIAHRDESGQLVGTISRGFLQSFDWSNANVIGLGDSIDSDELIGTSLDNLIFWDWSTVTSHTTGIEPPLGVRHFLPATSQVTAIDIFRLNDGNDILNLSYNRDVAGFQSYDFNATAYGGDGNDLLISGGGNDQLFGESGLDTVFGGIGNDYIDLGGAFAESFAELGFGGTGNDTIYGGNGNDTLSGGSEDDRLFGGSGLDTIGGDAGNDTIYGGDGEAPALGDALEGGSGDDTVYGGFGADNIDGGAGFLDRLFGGDGNDQITDSDGMVLMSGGAGADILYSNFSATWTASGNLATVYGGGGIDNFSMGSSQQNLNLVIAMDDGSADANDAVLLSNIFNQYATVTATLGGGDDSFRGSIGGNGSHIDRVAGDAGNDTLYGGAGSDTLYGGTGFLDFLIGGATTALAADAADVLVDSDGVAYARAGEGDDSLNITFASNWVGSGGNASDLVTLDGNGGADSYVLFSLNAAQRLIINTDDGGAADGNDVVDWAGIASSYDVITTFMRGGDDNYIGTGPGAGTGNRIDIVYGGLGNDTLSGGIGNDTLFGSDVADSASDTGGDTLFGRGGDDRLYGGAGADSLFGENGLDTLYGGLGDDTVAGDNGVDTLYGGFGIDTLDGGADNDLLYFNADNTVVGDNAAQDYVQGWDGSVQLAQYSYIGRTVNWSFDTFEGGAGIDSLVGTAGDDVLLANTDDLYINGAGQASSPGRMAGIEVVLLGAGADIFIANDPNGNTASGTAFTTSLSIYGGDGGDVVYTGNGDDRIVGDQAVGGIDILAGGVGNDTIWGDLQDSRTRPPARAIRSTAAAATTRCTAEPAAIRCSAATAPTRSMPGWATILCSIPTIPPFCSAATDRTPSSWGSPMPGR